jgi:hypothetical protein
MRWLDRRKWLFRCDLPTYLSIIHRCDWDWDWQMSRSWALGREVGDDDAGGFILSWFLREMVVTYCGYFFR